MYYIVKANDTIDSIASNFNISINDLMKQNHLKNNDLFINQPLWIPQYRNQEEEIYTVKQGDSLYSISKQFQIPEEEIIKINHLQNKLLHIGQKLYLTQKFKTPIHVGEDICILPEKEDTKTEEKKYDTYIVSKNDNLYSIAAKFHTDIGTIKYINHLTNNLLHIGQRLKIPKIIESTYQVKQGDSLYQIALKFNTTVESLMKKNHLVNPSLSIGQILKI